MSSNEAPLKGIRVIEAGVLLAGPFCGQLLGDFGAEVIKIEQPRVGDPMRAWGQAESNGHSLWWPIIARNKKSVELDLRRPSGQAAFRSLVAKADIVLENFRPGTFENWGIGYDQLKAVNPRIIMVRVTGYGQTGPYATRAGYASVGEAMGGLRHVVGYPDRPPSRVGISIGDTLAGTFAAFGAVLALHERARTGTGQIVDSAIYEACLAVMESLIPDYVIAGHIRERTGSSLKNVAPSNIYPTRDGELVIAANQDTVFKRLATAMERPELAEDPRYATHLARGAHQEELDALIGQWSSTFDSRALADLLERHGVPVGRIYTVPDMLEDAQFAAREAIINVAHDKLGRFPMQNVVPKLSRSPGQIHWVGPALGEHSNEILAGLLGLSEQEITEAQGVGQTKKEGRQ